MKNQARQPVFSQIIRRISTGQLDLPELPTVSIRLLQLIEANSVSAKELESALQFNPELESGLIKIANSPLYAQGTEITGLKEAVMRIGAESAAYLLLVLSIQTIFEGRLEIKSLTQRLQSLQRHSILVAVIAATLAKQVGKLDPAKAMLAGYTHDIGVLATLKHLDGQIEIVENKARTDSIVNELRVDVGLLMLGRWRFPKEFHATTKEAENWFREHQAEMDMIDLLQIAQMHAFIEIPHSRRLPVMYRLPAFKKLGLEAQSPQAGVELIKTSKITLLEIFDITI